MENIHILIFKIKDGFAEWSTIKTQHLAKNIGSDMSKKILEWEESISIMSLKALDSPVITMIVVLPLDMNMSSESWEVKNMIYNLNDPSEIDQWGLSYFC